MYILALT